MEDEWKAIWRHLDGKTHDLPEDWAWKMASISDAPPDLLTYWLKNEWLVRRNATCHYGEPSITFAQRTQDKHHCHLEILEGPSGNATGHIILLQFQVGVTEIHWRSCPAYDNSLKEWLELRYGAVPK